MSYLDDRKHPRARWCKYNDGMYFITVCTKNQRCCLGHISYGEMCLSEIGAALHDNISNISQHHSGVEIAQWVVMPNHFHLIIEISSPKNIIDKAGVGPQPVAAARKYDALDEIYAPQYHPFTRKSDKRSLLSVTIGGIRASVSRYAGQHGITFAWQSGFHDRIIRNQKELNLISEYIYNNPIRWELDCFHP